MTMRAIFRLQADAQGIEKEAKDGKKVLCLL